MVFEGFATPKATKGMRARSARPPLLFPSAPLLLFLLFLVSVVCDQVDQVVPAHQVDDIDEAHQVDPVHQVDHTDERCDDFDRFSVDIGRFHMFNDDHLMMMMGSVRLILHHFFEHGMDHFMIILGSFWVNVGIILR